MQEQRLAWKTLCLKWFRPGQSLRLRLTLWYLLFLTGMLLVGGIIIYTTQAQAQNSELNARLHIEITRIGSAYANQAADQIVTPTLQESLVAGNEIMLVLTPQGHILQAVAPGIGTLQASDRAWLITQAMEHTHAAKPVLSFYSHQMVLFSPKGATRQDEYAFTDLLVQRQQGIGVVVVVGIVDTTAQTLHTLLLAFLLVGLLLLAASGLGTFWLVDRTIHPVQVMTHMAERISETDLSQRLRLKRRDELGALAGMLDRMLERLEKAFERQRQFIADASHELRTPLATISLEATRVLEQPSTYEECQQALVHIQQASASMSHLVNGLLLLARAEGGQMVLQKTSIDLSEVVLAMVERLIPLAHQLHIRLLVGDLPVLLVEGEQMSLEQMITNVLENAIKYTSGIGTQVFVETVRQHANQQWWGSVRITDDGPGIAEEHLPFIFDRFYCVNPSRTHHSQTTPGKSSPSGSGLGLSLAQGIAHAHHGEIQVHTLIGHGSTFEIRLPLRESAVDN
jgi:signal transduction histidine kinase